MGSKIKQLLSEEDYEQLRLSRLANKIESGQYMKPYLDWLPDMTPNFTWNWRHTVLLCEHLQKVIDGECKKLMVFMPPRHGKTETITLRLPVYFLERNPRSRIILGAYNQTIANKFSVKIRRLAIKKGIELSLDRKAREDWETEAGGGVRAVGVGAGIAGVGGDLIIIDDPVRSRKDASSLVIRNSTYDWYTDDILTRRQKGAAIVIVQTRWHEDDLSGRILEHEDDWTVLKLPAFAEEEDPMGREVGEALCPDLFDVEYLLGIQEAMGRGFSALYQQRPVEQEGGMFKRSWFKLESHIRLEDRASIQYVRYWDKASSEGKNDYTVGALVAYSKDTKNVYIVDVVRGQWSTYDRDRIMLETAESDARLWGNVRIRHEKEPGASGIDSANATNKLLSGYPVREVPVRVNKVIRAEPFAAQCEAGNVYLLKGDWVPVFIDELTSFPSGKNDDQVDAASGGFNELADSNAFISLGSGW